MHSVGDEDLLARCDRAYSGGEVHDGADGGVFGAARKANLAAGGESDGDADAEGELVAAFAPSSGQFAGPVAHCHGEAYGVPGWVVERHRIVNALLKPAPELYELLSGNVVDGTLGPAEMIISFKLEKVLKHMTRLPGGLYNTSFAVLISDERFNKLSKQDQDAMLSLTGERLARRIGADWDKSEKLADEVMRTNNIQVVTASPAFIKEIRERIDPLEQKWIKEATGKGVEPAKALAELREEIKKVAAGK